MILLAQNDTSSLDDVVADWTAELDRLSREYEILLVDDGGNLALAELVKRFPRVRWIGHTVRRGAGVALRTALPATRFPLILTVPADRQYEPASLAALLDRIDDAHIVSGHRVWQRVPWPLRILGVAQRVFLRVLFDLPTEPTPGWLGWRGEAWWFVGRLLFGLRIRDQDCALRLYRKHVFERVLIQSRGDFCRTEILAKLNFLGFMMTEVPVPYHPPGSRTSSDAVELRRDLKRVFFDPDFGPYPLGAEGGS